MPEYRRLRIAGGTYFFTVDLADRASTALVDHIEALRRAYGKVARDHPFRTDAVVILPNHLHAVWTLPEGDTDFPTRWKKIKAAFTKAVAPGPRGSTSKTARGEMGLWQRRFWEHAIRDDEDYRRHVEYCWINPVKHGLVERISDWPYSSYHRDVQRAIAPAEWRRPEPTCNFGE